MCDIVAVTGRDGVGPGNPMTGADVAVVAVVAVVAGGGREVGTYEN